MKHRSKMRGFNAYKTQSIDTVLPHIAKVLPFQFRVLGRPLALDQISHLNIAKIELHNFIYILGPAKAYIRGHCLLIIGRGKSQTYSYFKIHDHRVVSRF